MSSQNTGSNHIVVGVVPGQDPALYQAAIRLARELGDTLAIVYADVSNAAEPQRPNAQAVIDAFPDKVPLIDNPLNEQWERSEKELLKEISSHMDGTGVVWRFMHVAEEPVPALARLAARLDARCIAVGTREPGAGPRLRELLGGSVASGLSHKQSIPVLVVPLAPREDLELPHD